MVKLREPDGKVDFIFIAMRFTHGSTLDPSVGYNYSGIATLGGNRGTFGMYGPSSITLDGKQIMADFPGSGVIAEIHNRWEFGNLIHEYFQHYYFGRVHNDIMGAWNINGGTIPCASDREHLEWNTEGTCYEPSSNTTITLNDYVSQGDYIKIPHSSGTFYIEHRRRLSPYSSSNWHTWRWRADVPITPIQRDSGIFIYRKHSAHSFTTDQASGRFNWKTCNTRSLIDEPIFINTFQRQQSNRYSGIGTESLIKKPVYDLNCQRIYQHGAYRDTLTYFGSAGDSNSCFDIGYNQVYSPWSNPAIVVNSSSDSLAIELIERNNGNMVVKIYFSNLTESAPAKPQDLKVDTCIFVNNHFRPRLIWSHNLEPDMNRTNPFEEGPETKRYKILRTISSTLSSQPDENSYTHIATVDINHNENPSYIDTSVISACYIPQGSCPPYCWIEYHIRYRIVAVDNTDKESVRSDLAATTGLRLESGSSGGGEEDQSVTGIENISEIPSKFDLKQNYPNPFNPITNIQYDIPFDNFVSIKIYDITGKVIKTLINEYKTAGSYIISFNAEELSSGIYFYRLETGNFVDTKRMILIK